DGNSCDTASTASAEDMQIVSGYMDRSESSESNNQLNKQDSYGVPLLSPLSREEVAEPKVQKLPHPVPRSKLCSMCGQMFENMCNLKRHEMKHTNKDSQKNSHTSTSTMKRFNRKNKTVPDTEIQHDHPYSTTSNENSDYLPAVLEDYETVVDQQGQQQQQQQQPTDYNRQDTETTNAATEVPTIKSARFSCAHCSKTFSHKGNLNLHVMKHTNAKPYSCSQCVFESSFRGNLNRHMKLHTGNYPYFCKICAKGCTDNWSLKTHTRSHNARHNGGKPYPCSLCDRSFGSRGDLGRHSKRHGEGKAFACLLCPKRFLCEVHLKRHEQTHVNPNRDPTGEIVQSQEEWPRISDGSSDHLPTVLNSHHSGTHRHPQQQQVDDHEGAEIVQDIRSFNEFPSP
ncbi:hypothetical protein QAD02_019512, partial [Eretmocerus hayati]